MGYIYKFTNLVNGKIYIGQTSRNLEQRYKEHIQHLGQQYDSQKNSLFHRALLKYGIENFSFECLEECDNELLNEREIYWIDRYNSCIYFNNSNGYNMNIGGNNNFYKIYNYDLIKQLWENGKTYDEIADIIGCAKRSLGYILNNLDISSSERRKRSCLYKAKSVEQYSLEGIYIQTFLSIADAANFINCNTSNISDCCNKKINSSHGYIWKYKDDNTPINEFVREIKNSNHHGKRKINQYDLNGNFIQTFNSLTEAKEAIGAKSVSSITNVCQGRAKSGYGFIWKYCD